MPNLNPSANAVQGLGDNFPLKMAPAMPGQEVNSRGLPEGFTRYNSGSLTVPTIGDMTVAGTIGTATFTLTFTYTGLTGLSQTKVVTYTATTGQSAADVAAALVAKINADPDISDVLIASNAAGVISFVGRRFRKVTAIAGAATGSATLTAASTIVAESTPTELPFGFVVASYPTFGPNQCSAVNGPTGLVILGLARHRYYNTAEYPYNAAKTNRGYPAHELVDIRTKGLFWVPVAAAVAKETVPAILTATGQLTVTGAGSSVPFVGATYKSAAPAGGLAIVSLNLTAGV